MGRGNCIRDLGKWRWINRGGNGHGGQLMNKKAARRGGADGSDILICRYRVHLHVARLVEIGLSDKLNNQ